MFYHRVAVTKFAKGIERWKTHTQTCLQLACNFKYNEENIMIAEHQPLLF